MNNKNLIRKKIYLNWYFEMIIIVKTWFFDF